MSRHKTDRDRHDRDTAKLTPVRMQEMIDRSANQHDKETVPEIPVQRLLAQYEKEHAEKTAKQSMPEGFSSSDEEPTDPGVPIKIGKDKVLWVEKDRNDRDDSDDTGEIIG